MVASRGAQGPYRLGPEITQWPPVQLGVIHRDAPVDRLSRELDETVDLSSWTRIGRIVDGRARHAAAGRERSGESFPLYCCATGAAGRCR